MKRTLFFIFTLLPLMAADDELATLKKAIDASHSAYLETLFNKDAARHAELFTEDAYVLSPGQPVLHGRSSIMRDKQAIFTKARILNGVIKTTELEMSGDLAYEVGRFSYTVKVGENPPQIIEGKFVSVWKRQADGSWLCHVDAGLPD